MIGVQHCWHLNCDIFHSFLNGSCLLARSHHFYRSKVVLLAWDTQQSEFATLFERKVDKLNTTNRNGSMCDAVQKANEEFKSSGI